MFSPSAPRAVLRLKCDEMKKPERWLRFFNAQKTFDVAAAEGEIEFRLYIEFRRSEK